MSLAPVDVMEEDAADLQFPKESDIVSVNAGDYTQHTIQHYRPHYYGQSNLFNCDACKSVVQEPFIKCAECKDATFCLPCFSQGAETAEHINSHDYIIRDDNVRVFPYSNWSAREEKKFVDLMLVNGFGNWDGISKEMKTKTSDECRDHYMSHYLDGIVGKMVGLTKDPYMPLNVPYLYKINSIEPPRHDLESHSFKEMAGYRCARGDFDTPYDNSAETIVSNLDLKNWNECDVDVSETLNCAMFNVYNHRLRERRRRYKVIKEHGLLVANRTLSWLSKYSEALGCNQNSNSKSNTGGRFIAFMQLMTGVGFDSIVEGLQYAHDLKKYVFRLYEVRKNGITTFHGGKVFHKLRAQRMSRIRDKRAEQFHSQWEWKQLMPTSIPTAVSNNPLGNLMIINAGVKRKSTPLEILGLPSYDKLTEEEKELCSTIRLVPTAYLSYKSILMSENTKSSNLRLADARRLIKIDVNKTRQLYDFLLKSGFINKPDT